MICVRIAQYLRNPNAHANVSTGSDQRQTYDTWFTVARCDGNTKLTDARLTLDWNGVLIQNDIAVPVATGFSPAEVPGLDRILLQDHTTNASGEVRFRNIWVVPANTYSEKFIVGRRPFGLSGVDMLATSVPAKDGLSNLWKYAAAANPTVSSLPSTSMTGFQTLPSRRDHLNLTLRPRIDHASRGMLSAIES